MHSTADEHGNGSSESIHILVNKIESHPMGAVAYQSILVVFPEPTKSE